MTGTTASVSVLVLAGCLACLSLLSIRPALAQPSSGPDHASSEQIPFDIPSQPLVDALKAHGLATGMSVLASSEVLRQRVSHALKGRYAPGEALRRMLEGTGLQVRFLEARAAVIYLPEGAMASAGPAPLDAAVGTASGMSASDPVPLSAVDHVQAGDADYRPYVGSVQARLVRGLCRSAQTRPGDYRLAVQLRIAGSGAVAAARYAGSTGDPARDAAIEQALRGLRFDPPPPSMPQPVTLLLRPGAAGNATGCEPAADKRRG